MPDDAIEKLRCVRPSIRGGRRRLSRRDWREEEGSKGVEASDANEGARVGRWEDGERKDMMMVGRSGEREDWRDPYTQRL